MLDKKCPLWQGLFRLRNRAGDPGISRRWVDESEVIGSHDLAEFLLVLGFSLKMNMPYEIIELHCCYVLGREEMCLTPVLFHSLIEWWNVYKVRHRTVSFHFEIRFQQKISWVHFAINWSWVEGYCLCSYSCIVYSCFIPSHVKKVFQPNAFSTIVTLTNPCIVREGCVCTG